MSAVIKSRRDRNLAKSDMIEVEGVVVESLPNTTFQVDIGNGYIQKKRGFEQKTVETNI